MSRLLLLLCLPMASAHRPVSAEAVVEIDRPKVSHAVTGTFETGVEVFTIQLSYDQPFAMPLEILVPVRNDLELHRPAYAVVGPGLPTPTEEEQAWLPFTVDEGLGVFIERNGDEPRDVYFENVMRRTMWTSGSFALHLPEAGDYEIWVWSPNLTTGDFQLGFGVEEVFSGGAWGPIFSSWGDFAW